MIGPMVVSMISPMIKPVVQQFFTPADLFKNGEQGAWYDSSDISTLFQDSTGLTPVTGDGDPVGLMVDKSGNSNDASQAVSASRPTFNTPPNRATMDKVDDNLDITIPVGGWTGTQVIGTTEGTAVIGISIPAGAYTVAAGGGLYFPGTNIIGNLYRDGALTQSEIDNYKSYLASKGAPKDYGAYVGGMVGWFRNRTDITSIAIESVGGVNIFASFVRGCSNLTSLDVSDWDTSSSTNFGSFANDCTSLQNLDVSNWDTSSAGSFGSFADDCTSLQNLDVSGWDTSNVSNFGGFIRNCSTMTSLDISGWDVSNVTNIASFASGCTNLVTITVGSAFDSSTVTNFSSAFTGCALNQSSVDAILISINNAGTSNGTLDINGGTSSAPSAAGNVAKTALQGRGWVVNTN